MGPAHRGHGRPARIVDGGGRPVVPASSGGDPGSGSGGGSGSETQRLANPVDKPVNLSVLDTANDDQNTSNQTARLMPQTINYHLIAASFNTLQSAQNYIENLSEGSLDAIILLPPEGSSQTYRISIYRSKDKNKVESFKTKLEKLGRKSGWIYKELNVK